MHTKDENQDFNSADTNQEEKLKAPAISLEEEERLELLMKTDAVKGEQLTVDLFGEMHTEKELRDFAVGKVQDPDKMYQVYYMGIDRLLDRFLPKGETYREQKHMIYEEKNVFLTRGHRINKNGIRGADGRMGYPEDGEHILDQIVHWAATSRNMAVLYKLLLSQNVALGYGYPL